MAEDGFLDEFAAQFREMYPNLCDFVTTYVTSRAVAEDLVQDLFLRIWEQRKRWLEQLPSRTYLYRGARNRALDHLRHERIVRKAEAEQESRDVELLAPDVESEVRARSLAAAIDVAVVGLPPRTRQTFVLSRGHGLSYAEIAEVMDVSVKTVEGQMSRAFRLLRKELSAYL